MRTVQHVINRCRPWLAPAVAAAIAILGATPQGIVAPVAAHQWEGDSYILLGEGRSATMVSGHTDDLERARELRQGKAPLLYVRRDGKAYVVRDAATLAQAKAVFEPQVALGRQQAELGSRQAELGSQQAALGAQQAKLSLRHVAARGADSLAREQDALGKQQAALGARQGKLGEEQRRLGEQQERLGREARSKFRALVDDAFRRGLAQPVG